MKQRQHSARLFAGGVPAEDRLQLLHGGLRLCGRCRYRRAAVAGIYTAFRKVTSDPIPPEEMVEGVGYFQFVYADGETRTFRYASEEQGLWIGEDERCLVDGQAFYDWQERLMEALQK